MFDIGFGELLLVLIIGLVVLGPERLPVAVRTVAGWVRTLRSLAATVQNELSQELKLQELQGSLEKAEQVSLQSFLPELETPVNELEGIMKTVNSSYESGMSSHEYHTLPTAPEITCNEVASMPPVSAKKPDNILTSDNQILVEETMTNLKPELVSNKSSVSDKLGSDH